MPAAEIRQTDLSMIIQRNASLVGSLTPADPNSHSFQNSDRQQQQQRKGKPAHAADEDSSQIASQTNRHLADVEEANVGKAISFNQTQEAFLGKVEVALHRMSELTVLARTPGDAGHESYETEFHSLQSQVRAIGAKLFQTADLFYESEPGQLRPAELTLGMPDRQMLNEFLDCTSDPEKTAITSLDGAATAQAQIETVLSAVSNLRTRIGADLRKLSESIGEMNSAESADAAQGRSIKDVNVAEANTRQLRNNILVQSGTAMLAQANALPQSALRLLR